MFDRFSTDTRSVSTRTAALAATRSDSIAVTRSDTHVTHSLSPLSQCYPRHVVTCRNTRNTPSYVTRSTKPPNTHRYADGRLAKSCGWKLGRSPKSKSCAKIILGVGGKQGQLGVTREARRVTRHVMGASRALSKLFRHCLHGWNTSTLDLKV